METKKKNTKVFVFTIVTIITFLLAVVGASFAYFIAQKSSGASANTVVKAETTDALTFQAGNPINIEANQFNFGSGAGNKSYETTATVNLRANTGNNTATYNYYVYLDILTNNFDYTTGATKTPELIMTLTDQNGNEVKTLTGYNYVTSGGVSGFDVTRTNGLVKLVDNKVITTTSNVSETWKVKITFVNLSGDQQKNTGKTFTGAIKIQKDMIPTIATSCVGQNMASCIKTNYELDHGIDYHTSALANGANDNSYRYSGANPNNYVCFGPGATAAGIACPEENQYRIIGIFGNQVKLIKKNSLGSKVWNTNKVNNWTGSTMDTYLNGEYLNSLTPMWSNKIATTTWQVGGVSTGNTSVFAKTTFNYEVGDKKANVTASSKIGLMYVSDYGFAASPSSWTIILGGYGDYKNDYSNPIVKANNWLFTGSALGYEWTMSRNSDYSVASFCVTSIGNVYGASLVTAGIASRAVFYLQSSVNFSGGNGSAIDPYRIN